MTWSPTANVILHGVAGLCLIARKELVFRRERKKANPGEKVRTIYILKRESLNSGRMGAFKAMSQ